MSKKKVVTVGLALFLDFIIVNWCYHKNTFGILLRLIINKGYIYKYFKVFILSALHRNLEFDLQMMAKRRLNPFPHYTLSIPL